MNSNHNLVCPTPEWADWLRRRILEPFAEEHSLGPRLIEAGPGPGAATEFLRHRVEQVTAVEIDPETAHRLRERFNGTNVRIVVGSAAALPVEDGTYDTAACFTMLHHVPTPDEQNAVLSELCRALRPGGRLVGSDSLPSDELRSFHDGDTYNPVAPETLPSRLLRAGFQDVCVSADRVLVFTAARPDLPAASPG